MAYNSNIPQPTDQLSVSQGDLLNNFQALATILNPNTGSITFVNQVSAPTFPTNQDGLYAITNGTTSVSELYVSKNIGGGATKQVPLTASILSTTANTNVSPGQSSYGWSYLPSGLIIQWGSIGGFGQNATVTVPFTFNFPTQCIQVIMSPQNTNTNSTQSNSYILNKSVSQFQFWSGSFGVGTFAMSWFAIGY